MAMFLITYTDPETGEPQEVEKEFHDSHGPHFISAKEWAEDHAYMLADKGRFTVKEIKNG